MLETITTRRLILRPIKFSDAEAMSRLASDYDVASMTGSIPHPFPVLTAEIKAMIFKAAWKQGREFAYAITKDGRELIGIISLFKRPSHTNFELGYWIGKPYWNHGFATEAGFALLNAAKTNLKIKTVQANAYADNASSYKVLRKLGFTETGTTSELFSIARLKKAKSVNFVLKSDDALLRPTIDAAIESR